MTTPTPLPMPVLIRPPHTDCLGCSAPAPGAYVLERSGELLSLILPLCGACSWQLDLALGARGPESTTEVAAVLAQWRGRPENQPLVVDAPPRGTARAAAEVFAANRSKMTRLASVLADAPQYDVLVYRQQQIPGSPQPQVIGVVVRLPYAGDVESPAGLSELVGTVYDWAKDSGALTTPTADPTVPAPGLLHAFVAAADELVLEIVEDDEQAAPAPFEVPAPSASADAAKIFGVDLPEV